MPAEVSSASDRAQHLGNAFNIWPEVGSETGNFQNEQNLKQQNQTKSIPPDVRFFVTMKRMIVELQCMFDKFRTSLHVS